MMLQKFKEQVKNTERGAIMVFFAILVPLFLGMIGFAVDAGYLYMQKAKLQDIADATALAGAGHLNDDDGGSKRRLAIKAFAENNGLKGSLTSDNFVYDESYTSDDAVKLSKYDDWKLAQKVIAQVTDKDGVVRDHVRVLIVKKVPTFFIQLLFPDQKTVEVRAAAEAEYVEGEETPSLGSDVPVIMVSAVSASDFQNYQSANNIVLGKNFALPIYIGSGNIDATKLPGTGNLYVNNVSDSQATYDEKNKKIVWNPPINGRDVYYSVGQYPAYGTQEYREAADEVRRKANSIYEETKNKVVQAADAEAKNLAEYKDSKGNKRFIGVGSDGKPYTNIKESDTEIELYMSGTYFEVAAAEPSVFLASARSVLTNRQLKNVKKINTLVSDKPCMLGTSEITYGNIYCLNWSSLVIAGNRNNFNGSIYTPSNLYVGGEENHFLGDANSSAEVSLLGQSVYLGKWNPITETKVYQKCYNFNTGIWGDGDCIKIDYNNDQFVDAKNRYDWHIYFGYDKGSGSSGSSSSSDSTTNAHVRLVI